MVNMDDGEINGADFGKLCGVTRNNIYTLTKQKQLTRSSSGKWNIHDPKNKRYLKNHAVTDKMIKQYFNKKNPPDTPKQIIEKYENQIKDLLSAVSKIISERYGEEEAQSIKVDIVGELRK